MTAGLSPAQVGHAGRGEPLESWRRWSDAKPPMVPCLGLGSRGQLAGGARDTPSGLRSWPKPLRGALLPLTSDPYI